MIEPLEDAWKKARAWLSQVIAARDEGDQEITRITAQLSWGPVGSAGVNESLPPFRPEGKDVEALFNEILNALEAHTDGFDPIPRARFRLWAFSGKTQVVPSRTLKVRLVDGPEDEEDYGGGGYDAPLSSPGSTTRYSEVQAHGDRAEPASHYAKAAGLAPTEATAVSGNLSLMMQGFLEQANRVSAMADKVVRIAETAMQRSDNQAQRALDALETVNDKFLDAQLNLKRAQLEADAERTARSVDTANAAVKQDLIKMFGTNVSKLMQMLMLKAAGVPPDSPEMMGSFIQGFIQSNPEEAKKMAAQLGINLDGGLDFKTLAANPEVLDKMVRAELERDPKGTMEQIEQLMDKVGEIAIEYAEKEEGEGG